MTGLSEFSIQERFFLHICYADVFKSGVEISSDIDIEQLLMITNQYIDQLEKEVSTYSEIHNNSLVFMSK